jgi:hypothetical protein
MPVKERMLVILVAQVYVMAFPPGHTFVHYLYFNPPANIFSEEKKYPFSTHLYLRRLM